MSLTELPQKRCSLSTDRAVHRHVFTGIAQYFNLTWSIWLRYCLDGKQDDAELVWPSLFTSVPTVERVDRGNAPTKKRQ